MSGLLKSAGSALLLLALASTAAAESLTLRDAVGEALARHPAIAVAGARQVVATAREAEARAGRFPRVDVAETVTRSNNPVFVFGSLLEQGEFAPRHFDPAFLNAPEALTNFRASITARYAAFDRFRTTTAVRQARNGMDRAGVELEETRQRVRSEAIARYYGVLVAQEKLAVAREAVRFAEADAKAARDRFEQGLVVESDALSADVQLAGFRQRVIAAQGELAVARAALGRVLQRDVPENLTLGPGLPAGETGLQAQAPELERALAQRAPVRSAASNVTDTELRLKAERGSLLPRVDAFGTFGASGGTFGDRNSDHMAGIAVTFDLFDRGRSARIAAARAEIDAARAGEALARDAVTMEVVTAWHRLRTARESASVAAQAVGQADAAARIVRDRYEQGLTTITEQLRAQTALVSARFELLAARYESLVAQAELLRATGDLNDVDSFI
ncbi:MAG: TolC family protein [Thermoanaerobaculia bacterium]